MRSQDLLSVGLAVLLAGCGPEVVGPRSNELARLRLASASPDAGALDLVVNGMTVARAVASTAASTPTYLEPGRTTGQVLSSASQAALASVPLTLAAGKSYTVLVAGPRDALTAMVSEDTSSSAGPAPAPPPTPPGQPVDSANTPPPVTDAVKFRLMHAAPHAPPLDPYLLPAGAALDTLPTLQPFTYGSLSLTADLIRAPGHYVVKFTDAGTTHVVLESGDIDAAAGELLTVVLGENGDQSLRVDVVRGTP
ncbi:MAG TPA: DUF4397 domain-containing protein [Gemmatimonadales bacterium]|nr:DUF4397 domain-containing protein [Gemmatimonadales bacterium]